MTAWEFGVQPLPRTQDAAASLRRLAEMILAIESPDPRLETAVATLATLEQQLDSLQPPNSAPRVGPDADGNGRVYIDHSKNVGRFNPCFPEYDIAVEGSLATGEVNFPVVYEGPPGYVHGGVLATFFDCVVQHHNCDLGTAGKTTSLSLRYRRPTPLLSDLTFSIERETDGRRITSVARLAFEAQYLCEATVEAVAGSRDALPAVGVRRRTSTENAQ